MLTSSAEEVSLCRENRVKVDPLDPVHVLSLRWVKALARHRLYLVFP